MSIQFRAITENTCHYKGILIPGMDALILRPDGTHCLPDEAGELYVKGGNVALGTEALCCKQSSPRIDFVPKQAIGTTPKLQIVRSSRVVGLGPEIGSAPIRRACSGLKTEPR